MSQPQTVTNAHPVAFDHTTFLRHGDNPPAEAVWDAKVRALDTLIEQGRVEDDEPLQNQIAYLDGRWPHWVDEVDGWGQYVPADPNQAPNEGAWMWRWGPKVFTANNAPGKRSIELVSDDTEAKPAPVVRAAGRTDEELAEVIMATISMVAEPLGSVALRREVGGNREQTARVLDALIAAGRVEKRRGKVGNSIELWPVEPTDQPLEEGRTP